MEYITENYCRACLKPCVKAATDVIDVAEAFKELIGFKIYVNDIPKKICDLCLQQLECIEEFKNVCKQTEEFLESLRHELAEKSEDEIEEVEFLEVEEIDPKEARRETVQVKMSPIEIDASVDLINFLHNEGPPPKHIKTESVTIKKPPCKVFKSNQRFLDRTEVNNLIGNTSKTIDYEGLLAHIDETSGEPTPVEQFVLNYQHRNASKRSPCTDPADYESSEKYVCDFCGKSYSVLDSLRLHLKMCKIELLEAKPCPNMTCKMKLFSDNVLKYHLEGSKCGPIGLKNGLACTHCDYISGASHAVDNIKTHLSSSSPCSLKPNFKCVCQKVTKTLDDLRVHCAKKDCTDLPLMRKLECNYCDFKCCLEANIRFHTLKMHADVVLGHCECGKQYYCDDLYLQHLVFQCDQAPESIKIPFNFMLAPSTASITANRSETFLDSKSSKKLNNSNYIRIICEICGKEMSKSRLLEHMNACHMSPNERPRYQCDLCKRSYNEKYNLKKHIMGKHLNQIQYPCQYCDRVFTQWSSRLYHTKRKHTMDFSHVCGVCAKRFVSASQLTYHTATHSDIRKFPCPECDSLFKSVKELGAHKKNLHSKEWFPCPNCDKIFKNRKLLRQHKNTHEEKSYSCPVCSIRFTVSHSLRGHVARKHPEYPMPPLGTQLRNVDINDYNPIVWIQEN